jgi:hypothetical protein
MQNDLGMNGLKHVVMLACYAGIGAGIAIMILYYLIRGHL